MGIEQIGLFVLLGFVVGTIGTLIGAGGGFILLPLLLLIFPDMPPAELASISLGVVFLNATSGSLAYARMKRIDYRSGALLALATLPGAILGAHATQYIPRRTFDMLLGGVLLIIAVFLLAKPNYQASHPEVPKYRMHRKLTDGLGITHEYSFNILTGMGVSFVVGFLSSMLGIGGGIIHVPVLVTLLHFPVPIATATSHFILAIMAFTGAMTHVAQGDLANGWRTALAIGAGIIVGAQVGAYFSHKIKPLWIVRTLAIALLLVGLRLVVM